MAVVLWGGETLEGKRPVGGWYPGFYVLWMQGSFHAPFSLLPIGR